jgi:hypothetical protein
LFFSLFPLQMSDNLLVNHQIFQLSIYFFSILPKFCIQVKFIPFNRSLQEILLSLHYLICTLCRLWFNLATPVYPIQLKTSYSLYLSYLHVLLNWDPAIQKHSLYHLFDNYHSDYFTSFHKPFILLPRFLFQLGISIFYLKMLFLLM